MSGGEQQMPAIGRALMARPRLLLLDEPSMGIARILIERIYETCRDHQQGTTILLVEQNANFAVGVSERAYVLETGTIALNDLSATLRQNPDVQKAYLGHDVSATLAVIGAQALYLLTAGCSRPSSRPTCRERRATASASLACGLLLTIVGVVIWVLVPSRPASDWGRLKVRQRVTVVARRLSALKVGHTVRPSAEAGRRPVDRARASARSSAAPLGARGRPAHRALTAALSVAEQHAIALPILRRMRRRVVRSGLPRHFEAAAAHARSVALRGGSTPGGVAVIATCSETRDRSSTAEPVGANSDIELAPTRS